MTRKEVPVGTGYARFGASLSERGHIHTHISDDPWERLMQTAPNQPVPELAEHLYGPLWAKAAELCNDDELAVLQMLYGAQLSQREAGEYLASSKGRQYPYSKTWIRKLRNNAFEKIREAFIQECFDETNGDD